MIRTVFIACSFLALTVYCQHRPIESSRELTGGNIGQIEGVAFSHNGKFLASADNSGVVVIRSMSDFNVVATLRGSNFTEVAWTSDDATLVAGGFDSLLYVWKWQTESKPITFRCSGQVEAVAISKNGIVYAAGGDKTIQRWTLSSRKELLPLKGHTDDVYTIKVSPNGKYLVSGGRDRTIRIWDLITATTVKVLTGHDDSIYDLDFSKEGALLVSGCRDGSVGIWNTQTWKMEKLLQGPDNSIHGIAVDPHGVWIAGAGFDNNLWLWKLRGDGNGIPFSGHRRKVSGVAFSPDGKWLASAASDITVRIWKFSE